MNIDEYRQSLNRFLLSDGFTAMDDQTKQRNIDGFRSRFIDDNPDQDPFSVNEVTESVNKNFLRGTGRGRYVPEGEDLNNIIFPTQEAGYNELSKEDKLEKIEEFKLKIPEFAESKPAQKEDMEFYLKQSARELERRANGEDRWKATDLAVRTTQGYLAGALKYVGLDGVAEKVEDYFHENAEFDEDFTSHLAQGLGDVGAGMTIFVVSALATRGAGGGPVAAMRAGTTASLASNGVMRYQEGYRNAIDAGLDAEKATSAGLAAMPAAAIDVLGDRILASSLLPASMTKAFTGVTASPKRKALLDLMKDHSTKETLLKIGQASLSEGMTEVVGDFVAAYRPYLITGIDDHVPTNKESLLSFAIGAVLGGGVAVAGSKPIPSKGRTETIQTPTGESSFTPGYLTLDQKRLGEVNRFVDNIDPARQDQVYDLLTKGKYKEAHQVLNAALDEMDSGRAAAAAATPAAATNPASTPSVTPTATAPVTPATTAPPVTPTATAPVTPAATPAIVPDPKENNSFFSNSNVSDFAKSIIETISRKWQLANPTENQTTPFDLININYEESGVDGSTPSVSPIQQALTALNEAGITSDLFSADERAEFQDALGVDIDDASAAEVFKKTSDLAQIGDLESVGKIAQLSPNAYLMAAMKLAENSDTDIDSLFGAEKITKLNTSLNEATAQQSGSQQTGEQNQTPANAVNGSQAASATPQSQNASNSVTDILNRPVADIVAELNTIDGIDNKMQWLADNGYISLIEGATHVDYDQRVMVLMKFGDINIPFYLSSGLAGKTDVASQKWYAVFGIGKMGWINKGRSEDINSQYNHPLFQKMAKILNEGIGPINPDDSKGLASFDSLNSQMNLGITPAKNNTDPSFWPNLQIVFDKVQEQYDKLVGVVAPAEEPVVEEVVEPSEAAKAVRDRLEAAKRTVEAKIKIPEPTISIAAVANRPPMGRTAIDELADISTNNPDISPIVDRIMVDLQMKNPEALMIFGDFKEEGGYSDRLNTIFIGRNNLRVVAHEVAHATTNADLNVHINSREGAYQEKLNAAFKDPATPSHIKLLIDVYRKAAKVLDVEHAIGQDHTDVAKISAMDRISYSFINMNEFLAEAMSNSEFQEALANIPYKGRNLWKVIVDAISSALNWMSLVADPELVMRSKGRNSLAATLSGINNIIYQQTASNEMIAPDATIRERLLMDTLFRTQAEAIEVVSGNEMLVDGLGNDINYLPDAKFSTEVALDNIGKSGALKAITPDKYGKVSWQALEAKLRKSFTKSESSMVIDAIKPFVNDGKIALQEAKDTVRALADTVVNNEVLSADTNSQQDAVEERFHQVEHELDTRFPGWIDNPNSLPEGSQELVDEWLRLGVERTHSGNDADVNDSATYRYSGVNPKKLNDMENPRDVIIQDKRSNRQEFHFPTKKGIIGFGRMYDEVLPDGEKSTFVFEVQSDWASENQKALKTKEKHEKDIVKYIEQGYEQGEGLRGVSERGLKITNEVLKSNNPLLESYENLVLKTVISQALDAGLNNVSITDAETAMMTEQHDKNASALFSKSEVGNWTIIDGPNGSNAGIFSRGQSIKTKEAADQTLASYINDNELSKGAYLYRITESDAIPKISQEKGMRAAYNPTSGRIHAIMRKLTKSKGVPVDFGLHQNSPQPNDRSFIEIITDVDSGTYEVVNKRTGESRSFSNREDANRYSDEQTALGSPVLKEKDGTPKKKITGINYPLDKVDREELKTIIGRGNKLGLNNINYSPELRTDSPITARQDALYEEIWKTNGDRELAEEMVALAARRAGYDVDQPLYRGDAIDWDVVDRPVYLSPQKDTALDFVWPPNKEPRKFYVKDNLRLAKPGEVVAGIRIKTSSYMYQDGTQRLRDSNGSLIRGITSAELKKWGYHGIIGQMDGSTKAIEVVLLDGENMKLADAFTFDINDKLIPLSQRFNDKVNNINYSPNQTRAKRVTNGYRRLNMIIKGKLNDKGDIRTYQMMKALANIRVSDVALMEESLQDRLFSIIDNIYEARKSGISNPQARIDSDVILDQIQSMLELLDLYAIQDMIGKYDQLINFDMLDIDTSDRDAVQAAITDYHDKLAPITEMEDSKTARRIDKIYDRYRKEFVKIQNQVIERFADKENYITEMEAIYARTIGDPHLREMLGAHFDYLTNVDVQEMKGKNLYSHFYSVNNMMDNNFMGMRLTADDIAITRDATDGVAKFAGTFHDPVASSNALAQGVDMLNMSAELMQVQADRLSAFTSSQKFIMESILGHLNDAIMRTSFNRKNRIKDVWISKVKEFEQKTGREMTTEDKNILSIFGRLVQFETLGNSDSALKQNLHKEQESIDNIIATGSPDNKKHFRATVKPLFDKVTKGAATMQEFMAELPQRMMGSESPAIGKARAELLDHAMELFSEFDLESRIISEGFYGIPFKQVVNYISSDVISADGSVMKDGWDLTDSLDKMDHEDRRVGLKVKAGHLQSRRPSLGVSGYYSYNINNTVERNIERIAVDNATISERFILAARLKKGSKLNNIISLDENGHSHQGRVDFLEGIAKQLVKNAISRGEPINVIVSGLRSVTNAFAKVTLSGLHHIALQPLSAMSDYAVRTGNISGWFDAARFYASNMTKVDAWFTENMRWVADRGALEAMALDTRRSPAANESEIMNSPLVKFLNKFYDGAGNVITWSIRNGDKFSAKITILAEYNRLLKQKGAKINSMEDFDWNAVEGRVLTQATLNVERNINTSNKIQRGELFSDRRQGLVVTRNLLVAFASHQTSLATQLNMALRDIKELVSRGATKGEIGEKIRTIGAIMTQSFVFVTGRYVFGASLATLMISLIKDLYDDEEGTIANLQEKVYAAEKKGDAVKLAIARHELENAKTVRTQINKMELRSQSTDSWFKQVMRDQLGSMFIGFSAGAVQNAIFLIPDMFAQNAYKETNEEISKDYATRIKEAKEAGDLKEAAKLTEKKVMIDAAEYIPFAYPDVGGIGLGGLYGSSIGAIKKTAVEFTNASMGLQEVNWNDFVLAGVSIGIGQADINKFLRAIDEIEDKQFKRNAILEKSGLPKAKEQQERNDEKELERLLRTL